MDILIHGKPNAGSAKATAGVEISLQRRIVDDFFASMEQHKYNSVLIVDARNWKNNWYSVYTYWLGENIKDTAGRPSYFALSIIVPNQYYCLVSEIFNHLHTICSKYIIGNYLTSNGNYIVQDFGDDTIFSGLVSKVNEGFVNLLEQFDSAFKPQAELGNSVHYNIVDCDAKSFVEDLRNYGRVIVSKKVQSRATFIKEAKGLVDQIKDLQNQVETKDKSILQLTQQIKTLQEQASSNTTSVNKKIKELQSKISSLESENEDIRRKYGKLLESNKSYREQLNQISEIVSPAKPKVNETPALEEKKPNVLKNIISKIDTFLLVLILIMVGFTFWPKSNVKEDNKQLTALQNIVAQKEADINALQSEISDWESKCESLTSQLQQISSIVTLPTDVKLTQASSNSKDLNCGLQIYQNNAPVNDLIDIDSSKPIMILVGVARDGYEFHYHNLVQSEIDKLLAGKPFMLTKSDSNKPITIAYRTSNRQNMNEDNKLIFN